MNILEQIREPVEAPMQVMERMLAESVVSSHHAVEQICSRLVGLHGKRMRPLLTLLVAQMHGAITDKTLAGAIIMELTHNASLLHDDVLDEAYVRRSQPTLNALVRSKGAVLLGDFLLSKGIVLGSKYQAFKAIEYAALTMEQLVEGELRQSEYATKLNITRGGYFEVIRLKTANLLAASAAIGALENASQSQQQAMYRLGELLGMAYQIKDDLLDFADGSAAGKNSGNDLKERKITLPLIYALEVAPALRRQALTHLRRAAEKPSSIVWLRHFVNDNGGVDHCQNVMQDFYQQALEILSFYPQSSVRDALKLYARFVVQRDF